MNHEKITKDITFSVRYDQEKIAKIVVTDPERRHTLNMTRLSLAQTIDDVGVHVASENWLYVGLRLSSAQALADTIKTMFHEEYITTLTNERD